MDQNTQLKVIQIVAECLQIPTELLSINSTMESTKEWDSLKYINVVIALEDAFKMSFSSSEAARFYSIMNIQKVIIAKSAS